MHLWEKLAFIYELLEDDFSKKIFESKVESQMIGGRGVEKTAEVVYSEYQNSEIELLKRSFGHNCKYAIAGAGRMGESTCRALTHAGYQVICFLDNDIQKQGKMKLEKPILSFPEFCKTFTDVVVILDHNRLARGFYKELMELGWRSDRVFWNVYEYNGVRASFGNIYFDLPQMSPGKDEVFIDAGSYDGETSLEFIKWCGGNYEKIYMFEPFQQSFEMAKENLKKYKNITAMQCALADYDGETEFTYSYDGLMGARIGKDWGETITVPVKRIDSILNGDRVSLIKMDIEGAELSALKGAEKVICKYKPRLAISMYHRPEDLVEIPLWIKNVRSDYKFYLRQYSNKRWDFVLYCV